MLSARFWFAAVVCAAAAFVAASLAQHAAYLTQAWDMGIFDQIFWNAARGRGFVGSIEEVPHHFGVHLSPWLYALLPIYALFPGAPTLLVLQAAALALGGWAVFLLARRVLSAPYAAAVLTGAYLVNPALHGVLLFDFHPIAFFIPLLLFGLYFFARGCVWRGALFCALAAATEEGAALAVAAAGVFVALAGFCDRAKQRAIMGAAVTLGAVLYVVLAAEVIMPAFGGGVLRLDRYTHLGASPGEIAHTLVTRPGLVIATVFTAEKMLYLFWLFVPVVFLPLVAPRAWILLVPGILQNLLTNYAPQFTGTHQYDALLIPALFVGAIYGLQTVGAYAKNCQRAVFAVLMAGAAAAYIARSPLNVVSFAQELVARRAEAADYARLAALVPDRVSIAAPTELVAHLARREEIFVAGAEPRPADVVVVDRRDLFGFRDRDHLQAYLDSYALSGAYQAIVFDERYFFIYKKTLPIVSP